jgi:hypothetical protein
MTTHHVPPGVRRSPDRSGPRRAARAARLFAARGALAAAPALLVSHALNTVAAYHALAIKYPQFQGD